MDRLIKCNDCTEPCEAKTHSKDVHLCKTLQDAHTKRLVDEEWVKWVADVAYYCLNGYCPHKTTCGSRLFHASCSVWQARKKEIGL